MNLSKYLNFDDFDDSNELFKSLNFEEFERTPCLAKQDLNNTDLESFLSFSSLCESDDEEIENSLINS